MAASFEGSSKVKVGIERQLQRYEQRVRDADMVSLPVFIIFAQQ